MARRWNKHSPKPGGGIRRQGTHIRPGYEGSRVSGTVIRRDNARLAEMRPAAKPEYTSSQITTALGRYCHTQRVRSGCWDCTYNRDGCYGYATSGRPTLSGNVQETKLRPLREHRLLS
ncbi:hypothetical protein ACFLQN_04770 [Candidatus Aenigmatarchaeota archaeon]